MLVCIRLELWVYPRQSDIILHCEAGLSCVGLRVAVCFSELPSRKATTSRSIGHAIVAAACERGAAIRRQESLPCRESWSLSILQLDADTDTRNNQNQCLDHFGFNACTVWIPKT